MEEHSRARRRAVAVVGWLAAAALATGVALAAVSSIGAGIFGNSAGPVGRQQIADALAAVTPSPQPTSSGEAARPSPDATRTATPEQTGTPDGGPSASETPAPSEPTVITSSGGTVVARCAAEDRVEVLSWSPNQGYRVDNAEHGPASGIDVEFESDEHEVEIRVRCVDGAPDATIEGDD